MKTPIPPWVAVALSASLLALGACKRPTSSVPPVANPSATPSPAAEIAERAPVDLSVGEKASTVAVQRRWLGGETLHSHFGRGWADDNVVRLTQVDRDAVLIWRGGRGWRVAHRDGEKFKTLGGGEITKNAKAWTYRSAGKESAQLEFDPEGRLKMERTLDGLTRSYGYDALGRLASISAKPNESIEYKYDANDRVSSVEGPNGKHATYSYKNDRLAEATNSASEKRAYSYDVGSGTLVVAIQGVARGVQTVAITAGSAGAVATVGIAALVVADVLAIAEVGYKAKTGFEAWNAASEEKQAEAVARSIRNALENKLRETLRNDPGRVLKLASGRKPDPNKPGDVEELLNRLHANQWNNRKPFEGVLGNPPDPEQEKILAAALKKARELLAEGWKLEEAAWNEIHGEQSPTSRYFNLRQKLTATTMGLEVSPAALATFNQVVEDMRTHTARVQGAAQRLQAAMKGMIAGGERTATTTCETAQRSGQMNNAEAETARAGCDFLISQATEAQLGFAKEIKEALDVSDLRLREVLPEFLTLAAGYRAALSDAKIAEATAAIEGIKTAIAKMDEAPAHLAAVQTQLARVEDQIVSVLAPVSRNPESMLVLEQAHALGTTLVSRNAESPEERAYYNELVRRSLARAESHLPTLRQIAEAVKKADVETLIAAADGALDSFKKNGDSARSQEAQSRANAALKRATDCLAQIKGGGDQIASASPTPQKDDEVTVPDLSVFERSELDVVLKNAGLVKQLVAAKEKAPSMEKEFKFAGQSPAPNTKVKRGSVVSVEIYSKFEDEEVTVPDLSVFDRNEFDAVLKHAGLVKQLVAAKAKTPSKEKEFKFAGQSPAPNAKVKRGSVVSVAVYSKFEDAAAEEVTVPDLSAYLTAGEMEAALGSVGLKRLLVSTKDKPPSKEKEFKFASQSPTAGAKAKRGDVVAVSLYPKFEDAAADEVTVPDLSGFSTSAEMKSALSAVGLSASFAAASSKPPSKEKEFKFAGQSPAAGTSAKRGEMVAVSMYQKFEDSEEKTIAAGTVPDVIGLEIRVAQAKIEAAGLKLVGVESGTLKPPTPDKAYRIYSQTPKAGEAAPSNKFVSVKEYGSGKTSEPEPAPSVSLGSGGGDFEGQWVGVLGVDSGSRATMTFTIQRTANGYAITMSDNKTRQPFQRTRVEGDRLIGEFDWDLAAALPGGVKGSGDLITGIYKFRREGDDLVVEGSAFNIPSQGKYGKFEPMGRLKKK